MKKIIIIIWLITICTIKIHSQTVEHPNYALKSHETLEISKVEMTVEKTLVFLTVENRRVDGNFCADRNIYIIDSEGMKLNLKKATGIPVCPDTHKFKSIGEKFQFTLEFPPLKSGTKWIDVIEDCNNNCFSIYCILLNNELNRKIDEAVILVDRGEIDNAIVLYKSIIQSSERSESGILGSLYTDLISLLIKKGYNTQASEWYNKLLSSNIPMLQIYINNLNSRGIKF